MDRGPMILRVGWRVLIVALTWTAAAYALRYALRGLDWPVFHAHLRSLEWRWVALAVAFDIASYVAQGIRWRLLLGSASVWHTTRAIYAGLFINELVPLRPGEALRAWLAARDSQVSVWNVVPTMFTERVMDGFWLAIALLAVLPVAPLPASIFFLIRIVVAVLAMLLLLLWLLGQRYSFRVQSLRNPRALMVSGCFLAAQGLAFWATGRASHISLTLLSAFVVMLIVRLGTMLPGAPANLGAHQFSTVLGLSLYAVSQRDAAIFSVVVFAVLTVPLCLLGLVALLSSGLTLQNVRQSLRRTGRVGMDQPQLTCG